MATQKEMLEAIMEGQVALAKRVAQIESGADAPAATPKASKAKAKSTAKEHMDPKHVVLGKGKSAANVRVATTYGKDRVGFVTVKANGNTRQAATLPLDQFIANCRAVVEHEDALRAEFS